MEFYGGNTNFHPLGIFITCHAMSIMCNSQPNSFQNKSSTIRAQYNTNLVAKFHTLDIFREGNFNKRHLQHENMIYPYTNQEIAPKKIKFQLQISKFIQHIK